MASDAPGRAGRAIRTVLILGAAPAAALHDVVLPVKFVVLAAALTTLESLIPARRQRHARSGMALDITHFFLSATFAALLTAAAVSLLPLLPAMPGRTSTAPFAIRMAAAVVTADVLFYWTHRLLHANSFLWGFHAVHHSSEEMDWLSAFRIHPLEGSVFQTTSVIAFAFFGVTGPAVAVYSVIAVLISATSHANVDFRGGTLRYIVTTPEYHGWHHTAAHSTREHNYAALLPATDWLFGTLHLDDTARPDGFGTATPVPLGYAGQLLHPLTAMRRRV